MSPRWPGTIIVLSLAALVPASGVAAQSSPIPGWTLVTSTDPAFSIQLPPGWARDSASADVHVTFVHHFDEPISGRTKWARDDDWWIIDADIVLAVHNSSGRTLDDEAMKAMALHEIGHLLGLDHTEDLTSIMAPRVRVRDLSPADLATVRLLYTLPPGGVR